MIMAAGVGSRLDPLTRDVQKRLSDFYKPLMDIILTKLEKLGINDVVSNTFCLPANRISLFSKQSTSAKLHCIRKNVFRHCRRVKKCEFFFDGEKTFLVLSGDGLTE
jgi:NDP-sugar pyrophosphorylase family protein